MRLTRLRRRLDDTLQALHRLEAAYALCERFNTFVTERLEILEAENAALTTRSHDLDVANKRLATDNASMRTDIAYAGDLIQRLEAENSRLTERCFPVPTLPDETPPANTDPTGDPADTLVLAALAS